MLLTHTLKLTCSDRCRAVETPKSYALRWRNSVCFIPRSYCKMYEINDGYYRWVVEIPSWLLEKNEKLARMFNYIKEQNDEIRDGGFSYN